MDPTESRDVAFLGDLSSRRTFLRGSLLGGSGLLAAALIGCGDDDDDDDDGGATATASPAGDATSTPSGDGGSGSSGSDTISRMNQQAEREGAPYPYDVEETGTPKKGGTFIMSHTSSPATWDISQSTGSPTLTIPNMVYNRLLGLKAGPGVNKNTLPELEPELADSWEVSPDGLKHTFNLHPGINFHNVAPLDGRAFTAEDVKFVYERHAVEGVHQQYMALKKEITAPDDNTLVIDLTGPSPDFAFGLATRYMAIYPHELVDQELLQDQAVGTGPFIVRERVEGSHVNLDSNQEYFEGTPWIDGIEYRVVRDKEAYLSQLRVGQLDVSYAGPSSRREAESVLAENPDFVVLNDPVLVASGVIGMQLGLPKFADERVRQALMLGYDRDLAIDLTLDGDGGQVPTAAWSYVMDEPPDPTRGDLGPWWRYDPAEARKMLAAAGYENLQFELLDDTAGSTAPVEVLQEIYRDIGVTMDLNLVDITEFTAQWSGSTYPEAASGFPTAAPTADGFYHAQVHSTSGANRFNMNDPQIDEWAEQQQVELDPDVRREIQRKIFDRVLEQAYRIENPRAFGWFSYQPWVHNVRFNYAFIALHAAYDWGDQLWKAWLDR